MVTTVSDATAIREHEPKWTRKVRTRIHSIQAIDTRLFKLRRQIEELEVQRRLHVEDLGGELTMMRREGEPDTPWARHWRINELGQRS